MKYIYPAVFEANSDGTYTITFPDLPGCISEGKNLDNALRMAQQALTQWIEYLESKKNEQVPGATDIHCIEAPASGFVNFVSADIRDTRAVRRTVSLPKWMDDAASTAGVSLSKVLQDALASRLDQR